MTFKIVVHSQVDASNPEVARAAVEGHASALAQLVTDGGDPILGKYNVRCISTEVHEIRGPREKKTD